MLIVDTLLFGGIKFVLAKIAQAVESELNDESRLREELLAAQMRFELGEISDEDFATLESELLRRLRELREQAREEAMDDVASPRDWKVTGIEATTWDDDEEPDGR